MRLKRTFSLLLGTLLLTALAGSSTSHATPVLPNPVLYLTVTEIVTIGGKTIKRYHYDVLNKDAYPDEMFAAAPDLPACGTNTKSSRTWVDIYDQRGKRLYGFCALSKAANLGSLWFAMDEAEVPPSYIYIEMNDRKTNTKFKSNLADTVL